MHRTTLLAIGAIIIILTSGFAAYYVLASKTNARHIRVACVGDSITEGSGYPDKLRTLLGSDYLVGNFGASGSTVSLNSEKPYMNQSKFQEAMDFHPDIVVIMLGTNDANLNLSRYDESFEDDYGKLVTAFQNLEGDQKILVVKSPPIFNNSLNLNNTYLSNNEFAHIDNLANQMNLYTVNVNDDFGNNPNYFYDGVHPTIEGAHLIAADIYDNIISVWQDNSNQTQ
jgi:lysophospholipase L1-like esterase